MSSLLYLDSIACLKSTLNIAYSLTFPPNFGILGFSNLKPHTSFLTTSTCRQLSLLTLSAIEITFNLLVKAFSLLRLLLLLNSLLHKVSGMSRNSVLLGKLFLTLSPSRSTSVLEPSKRSFRCVNKVQNISWLSSSHASCDLNSLSSSINFVNSSCLTIGVPCAS